jgi:hypothetical protein
MSGLKGIGKVSVSGERNPKLANGKHLLKILGYSLVDKEAVPGVRPAVEQFAVDAEIVSTTSEEQFPGMQVVVMVDNRNTYYQEKIVKFLAAGINSKELQSGEKPTKVVNITEEMATKLFKDQTLKGLLVEAVATNQTSKAGRAFQKVDFKGVKG